MLSFPNVQEPLPPTVPLETLTAILLDALPGSRTASDECFVTLTN